LGDPKPIINAFKDRIRVNTEAEEKAGIENKAIEEEKIASNIIDDAKEMYLKIIQEANSEAQILLETAKDEAQQLLTAATEDGYRDGYESGSLEGSRKAQAVIDEAAGIREFLEKRKCDIYKETEEQILQLILDISKKVIGDELTQNRESILSLINQALQKCTFKKKLVLKVSQQDYEFVLKNKDKICTLVEGISDIEIVSDLYLMAGSCIVETPSGEINSSIGIQIRELENIFTYILRNE
jgi:flagellar assembly protein FliH